jgi:hypothetical protein
MGISRVRPASAHARSLPRLNYAAVRDDASKKTRELKLTHDRRGPRLFSLQSSTPSCGCYNGEPVVGIAQLAEHRTVAPAVAGSIPVSHPKYFGLRLNSEDFRATNPRYIFLHL